jgi:hypothetical protein
MEDHLQRSFFPLPCNGLPDGTQKVVELCPGVQESPAYLLDNGYTEEAKELIESYKLLGFVVILPHSESIRCRMQVH